MNIKNRAWIEILSSKPGLRVDSVKARELLCKSGSADHFSLSLTRVGNKSGPLDLHRAVQGEGGTGAAAQSAGGACPRRGFAGVEKSGAPGAYSDRGLAVEHPLGMRNPPVRSGQWIGPRGVVLAGDGGVERRNIAGVRHAGN